MKSFPSWPLAVILLLTMPHLSHSQWAKAMGGVNVDMGSTTAMDGAGNVYVAGTFNGTADFDPGPGIFNLTSAGGDDIFFARYDGAGNLLWAKSIGSSGADYAYHITIDQGGNIYLAGYFSGTVDFDPGAGISLLSSNGGTDLFFAKYNSSGELLWVKSNGGPLDDGARSIWADNNNIYVTGYFQSTNVDFDPGPGTTYLSSAGNHDIFFGKYDLSGNLVWVKCIRSPANNNGHRIAVDGSGNIYLAGIFSGTVDFDPNAGVYNLSGNGGEDIFFAKYNSSGNLLWARSIGGTADDAPMSISPDNNGNIYITGYFQSVNVDFDPGAGTCLLSSNGGRDIFFGKYDASGQLAWAGRAGGTDDDAGLDIITDYSNNVYITGYFSGSTIDFARSGTPYPVTSNGGNDMFFAKYNPSGDLIWARNSGGAGADAGASIATNGFYLSVAGYFNDTAYFEPGGSNVNLTSAGINDIFLSRYEIVSPVLPVKMLSFVATVINKAVRLDWMTATETNNAGFDIERNAGRGWQKIGFVAGHGNSNSLLAYSFWDNDPGSGKILYRLRQADFDGNISYSSIVAVEMGWSKSCLLPNYPNPFSTATTIRFNIASRSKIRLAIYDLSGKEITVLANEEKESGQYQLAWNPAMMAKGAYICKLEAGKDVFTQTLLLIP